MRQYTLSVALSALLYHAQVHAHFYLSSISGPSEQQPEGAHMPPFDVSDDSARGGFQMTAPVFPADTSPQMKCGTMGVPSTSVSPLPVSAGDTMTAQFLHDRGIAYDQAMNANHHGYCSVYLAPLASQGEGNVWTKIFQGGLIPNVTPTAQKWGSPALTDSEQWVGWWCTDQLRLNDGKMPFTLPATLPDGKYILRAEMLTTLLEGTLPNTAQAYLGCSVIQVGNGDGNTLPGAVALPEAYQGAPWIYYSLFREYINNNIPGPPGPPVWDGKLAKRISRAFRA